MPDELAPEDAELAREAAVRGLTKGKSKESIVRSIMEGLGWPEEIAVKLVDNIEREIIMRPKVVRWLSMQRSKRVIIRTLVNQGWTNEVAVNYVEKTEQEVNLYKTDHAARRTEQLIESPEEQQKLAEKYKRRMGYGLLWFIGGLIVSLITYVAAATSPTGGPYIVAWGAIIYGLFDISRGFRGWYKLKQYSWYSFWEHRRKRRSSIEKK